MLHCLTAEGVEQTGTLGHRRRGSSSFSCFLMTPPFPWNCYLYWAGIYLLPPLTFDTVPVSSS